MSNYGWPLAEGPSEDRRFSPPLYAYNHDSGAPTGCAITAGTFYDPPAGQAEAFPSEFAGDYFFADGCAPWIWRRDLNTNIASPFADDVGPALNLMTGPDGSLYYVVYAEGEVHRISFAGPGAPTITAQPASQTVSADQPATFRVGASGRSRWHTNGNGTAWTFLAPPPPVTSSMQRRRPTTARCFGRW